MKSETTRSETTRSENIRLNSLHKYYDKGTSRQVHVLNGVTLELPPTGLVCVLGESGSGKTTLINAAGGLDTFASGTVEACGRTLRGRMDAGAEALRNSSFGYIFQNYYLLHEQTVSENLRLALCLYDMSEEEKDARIEYVLRAVDMFRFRKRTVAMLSGGQRQRVAIARALIRTPRVIFADEPTGNLDEANTMLVMGILRKISKDCLVLVATHERRIANFFADRIISVSDGRVCGDAENDGSSGYARADDHDIYLDEFERAEAEAGPAKLDFYSNDITPLTLTAVRRAGRLYIMLPEDVKAEIVNERSDVKLVHGRRMKVEMEEIEHMSFELERLSPKKRGLLTLPQLWDMAKKGISSMGKRLILPIAALAASAVLSVVAVADYMTLSAMDPEDFIRTDSRYLAINAERGDYMNSDELTPHFRDMLTDFIENGPECIMYLQFNAEPEFRNADFAQLAQLSDTFYSYTYTPLSLLDESTLIYGRMPEAPNEVVIDRWVLGNFMDRETSLSKSVADESYFLGVKLKLAKKNYTFDIVGICDSGEPSMYIDAAAGAGVALAGTPVATLSSLQRAYPGVYDNVVLNEGEALVNIIRLNFAVSSSHAYTTPSGISYKVLDSFPEEFPAAYVISDDCLAKLLFDQAVASKSFSVFTDDKAAVKRFFADNYSESAMRVSITDRYSEQLATFDAAREVKLNARILVTAMMLAMAFAMVYVSMKTNAMRNLRTIGVYRLLGIRKGSVTALYALESLMLSALATLPACIVTATALFTVSGIESLGLSFSFTWGALALTCAALFAVNLAAGLLPIFNILRIPPAQLASRTDI